MYFFRNNLNQNYICLFSIFRKCINQNSPRIPHLSPLLFPENKNQNSICILFVCFRNFICISFRNYFFGKENSKLFPEIFILFVFLLKCVFALLFVFFPVCIMYFCLFPSSGSYVISIFFVSDSQFVFYFSGYNL